NVLGSCNVLLGMFLWLKTLYRKRAVTWPFIFYTIIWTLSQNRLNLRKRISFVIIDRLRSGLFLYIK
ncbi:hypothetical protein CWC55_12385, partial [Enterococcus faecalis]